MAREFQRLEIVALAIFNRKQQDILESELERDLTTLLGTGERRPLSTDSFHLPMTAAQQMLGRFFFVYKAEMNPGTPGAGALSSGDVRLRSYEFLHATFGEFLVARAVMQQLQQHQGTPLGVLPIGYSGPDDRGLRRLLAHQPLSNSTQVLTFVIELAEGLRDKSAVGRFLMSVMSRLQEADGQSIDSEYNPSRQTAISRLAAYSANVVLLHVAVVGEMVLPASSPQGDMWTPMATLWKGQLAQDSWHAVRSSLSVERRYGDDEEPVAVQFRTATVEKPSIDLKDLLGTLVGRPLMLHPGRIESMTGEDRFLSGDLSDSVAASMTFHSTISRSFDFVVMTSWRDYDYPDLSLGNLLLYIAFEGDRVSDLDLDRVYSDVADLLSLGQELLLDLYLDAVAILLSSAKRHAERLSSALLLKLMKTGLSLVGPVPSPSVLALVAGLAVHVMRRDGDSADAAARALEDALARLDLPHLLDADPGLAIELYALLYRAGLPAEEVLAEYGTADEFCDRFDLAVLAAQGAHLPDRLLTVARHHVLTEWAIRRGMEQALLLSKEALARLTGDNIRFLLLANAQEGVDVLAAGGRPDDLYAAWAVAVGQEGSSLASAIGSHLRDVPGSLSRLAAHS